MSSDASRLIDKVPTVAPRPVEMQVLALGMSRTGTMSMQSALNTLGYKSYHIMEAAQTQTFTYWLEALKAKYSGEGKPYQKAEFDKLLGNYSAVTDIPCIMFVDELLAAYPAAKIILTERDVESWMVSMNNTFYQVLGWKSLYYLAYLDPDRLGPYWTMFNFIINLWTGGDINDRRKLRQSYRDHYAHVRRMVPKAKILEFKPGDGFEQLCEFLDKPIPKGEAYPHINQPDNIIKIHKYVWWMAVSKVAMRFGLIGGALGAAVGALWYYQLRM